MHCVLPQQASYGSFPGQHHHSPPDTGPLCRTIKLLWLLLQFSWFQVCVYRCPGMVMSGIPPPFPQNKIVF